MEGTPKLGHDLSGVRIHTDGAAAQAALSVNANAFTAGNHVVFGGTDATHPARRPAATCLRTS